jgi:hypothetical protein
MIASAKMLYMFEYSFAPEITPNLKPKVFIACPGTTRGGGEM